MYRLSYQVNNDGSIVSNLVHHLDSFLFVLIEPNDKRFKVIKLNDEGHDIIEQDSYVTIDKAKAKARSILIDYGVILEP